MMGNQASRNRQQSIYYFAVINVVNSMKWTKAEWLARNGPCSDKSAAELRKATATVPVMGYLTNLNLTRKKAIHRRFALTDSKRDRALPHLAQRLIALSKDHYLM